MRNIRRAAVTGLFAIWLAPLSASVEAPNGTAFRADRPSQAERAAVEPRRDQEDPRAEGDAASHA